MAQYVPAPNVARPLLYRALSGTSGESERLLFAAVCYCWQNTHAGVSIKIL